MNKVFAVLYLSLIIVVTGCASSPELKKDQLIDRNPAKKPQWAKNAGYVKKGDVFMFVGESNHSTSQDDARQKALLNALAQVSNYFGVKVNAEVISKEQESDGSYSYDIGVNNKISGATIKIKNYSVEATYYEKWMRTKEEYDAKILISVPADEIARIKKEVDGITAWGYVSAENDLHSEIEKYIKEFAQKKNMQLQPQKVAVPEDYSPESLTSVADTAYFLMLKFNHDAPKDIDGEWFVDVTINVDFISLTEKKVLGTYNAQATGAAFSGKHAVRNGMIKAFEQIFQ